MSAIVRACRHLGIRILVLMIDGYRLLISPWLANSCRFEPTCSQYARQAIERHGPVKGLMLTIRRIGRCHPGHPGGYDPVP